MTSPTPCIRYIIMKRILFVDDDVQLLKSLKRMMRVRSRIWDMHFVSNGFDALTEFEREPFDVIVSDISMPEMEGDELLERVKKTYPQTVRIALSGLASFEVGLRASPVAQLILAKPCEGPQLCKSLEWAFGIKHRPKTPRHAFSSASALH